MKERGRWQFWRSPPDQPGWARPALLAVAALAALSYTWGIGSNGIETFYGATVHSMSESWRNFFFGALDPWGTVTIDKLPGAFWVQALSVRLFGFHVWSLVLPQALEGTLTVLVLYRCVRRVAGAPAGLTAAIVLAVTPITILLNRGNISDSLLILLLVLAADAATAAYVTGRPVYLVAVGALVGLGFQTKMLQAWVVLPALFGAYVLAAPSPALARRLGHVALGSLVAVVASLSYMAIVTAIPAHDRPYEDGSCNNSVFSQVFDYNAAARVSGSALDRPGCNPAPAPQSSGAIGLSPREGALPKGPGRFLSGGFGRDIDWLLVPAAVALGGILVLRRRQPRTDARRAAAVLWGTWLCFTWSIFASSHQLNAYYLAALAPAIASLCGLGLAEAWPRRRRRSTQVLVVLTMAGGTLYALWLLPPSVGVRPLVLATTLVLALGAVGSLAWSVRAGAPRRAATAVVLLSTGALLIGSAWAAGTAVAAGLGPFDTPYQAATVTGRERAADAASARLAAQLSRLAERVTPSVSVVTVENSVSASLPIFDTGREFLPVAGYSGRVPATTLVQFVGDVRDGKVKVVLAQVDPRTPNPDLQWAVSHCSAVRATGAERGLAGIGLRFFVCSPADARN